MKIEHIKSAKKFLEYTILDYIPKNRIVYTLHWFDGIRMNVDFDDPFEEYDTLEAAQHAAIRKLTDHLIGEHPFYEPNEYLDSRIVYHKNVCILQLYMDRNHHDIVFDDDYFDTCEVNDDWVDAAAFVIDTVKYGALE